MLEFLMEETLNFKLVHFRNLNILASKIYMRIPNLEPFCKSIFSVYEFFTI